MVKSTYTTTKDAALRMGVDERTIRRWANRGIIRAKRRGKFWYVDESDVLDVRRGKR